MAWSLLSRKAGLASGKRKLSCSQVGNQDEYEATRGLRTFYSVFFLFCPIPNGVSVTSVSGIQCKVVLNSSVNSLSEGIKHVIRGDPSPRAS